MKFPPVLLGILGAITGCQFSEPAPAIWSLKRVIDGDTFVVMNNGEEQIVELCGMDAPELEEAHGQAAKQNLASLVGLRSNEVGIVVVDRTAEGHMLAEGWVFNVPLQGEAHLNSQMLREGMAVVDEGSLSKCPNKTIYPPAVDQAREEGLGIWQPDDF